MSQIYSQLSSETLKPEETDNNYFQIHYPKEELKLFLQSPSKETTAEEKKQQRSSVKLRFTQSIPHQVYLYHGRSSTSTKDNRVPGLGILSLLDYEETILSRPNECLAA